MRSRVRAALAVGVLFTTVGSGVAFAPRVVAASRAAAPSRMSAEPLNPKMRLVQQQLTSGRPTRTSTRAQTASSLPCTSSWMADQPPDYAGGRNVLTGIAAIAPNDIWAVGYFVYLSTDLYQTLADHWDGSTWTVVPTPNLGAGNNVLTAVTVIGPNDVWAVGYWTPNNIAGKAQPLTEHWNGNSWSVVPAPPRTSISAALYGVGSDGWNDVWAVGIAANTQYKGHPYVLRWNGSSWSVATAPTPQVRTGGLDLSGLNAVKVLAANDVWAVGDGLDYTGTTPSSPDTAFIEHWDGVNWSHFAVSAHPNGDFLIDVQGTASDLWAVGGQAQALGSASDNVLIEHWTGTGWTDVVGVTPDLSANLLGIGYLGPNNVFAVGASAYASPGTNQETDHALIEQWNGTSWIQQPSPISSPNDDLLAVAAISASDIWSAGVMYAGLNAQPLTDYFCVPPNVTNVAPASGDAGTTVKITGTGFTKAIDVEFGATPAFSFQVDSDTQITAVIPGHKPATVDITVTVQGTSATSSADQFTYTASRSGAAGGSGLPFSGGRAAPPPDPAAPPHPRGIARGAPIPI